MKEEGAEVIIILTSSGVPWDREEEYEKFVYMVISGEIDEYASLNALQMAYYLEDVDFVIAGGNSKGYWLPWYDPHSHVYVMQGYGGGTAKIHHEPHSRITKHFQPVNTVGNKAPVKNKEIGY